MPNDDFIEKHFQRVGLDPNWGRRIMRVESGGNPNATTGSYHGLFQLSPREFRRWGGTGDIHDPEQNTMAAANKIANEKLQFEQIHDRPATLKDVYGVHQQGAAGYDAHLTNPSGVAWKNVRQYYPSDKVAKDAIWKNLTPTMQAKYGSVDSVSSAEFTKDWGDRIEGVSPARAMARAKARREAIPEIEEKPKKEARIEVTEVPPMQPIHIPGVAGPEIQLARPARVG